MIFEDRFEARQATPTGGEGPWGPYLHTHSRYPDYGLSLRLISAKFLPPRGAGTAKWTMGGVRNSKFHLTVLL